MELQVVVTGKTLRHLTLNLKSILEEIEKENCTAAPNAKAAEEDEVEEKSEIHTSDLKEAVKRGRPKKEAVQEEFDLGDEAAEEKKEKKLTLEDDIIPAFKEYAKKKSREDAGKVLSKYKVKSVRDLPADKYPEILKTLGA